jgi:hypothetical protein
LITVFRTQRPNHPTVLAVIRGCARVRFCLYNIVRTLSEATNIDTSAILNSVMI